MPYNTESSKKLITLLPYLLIVILLPLNLFVFWRIRQVYQQHQQLLDIIQSQKEEIMRSTENLVLSSHDEILDKIQNNPVLEALLADKVEELVSGVESEQEQSIQIAQWIAANISNRYAGDDGVLNSYAQRSGDSMVRSQLLIKMLSYRTIPASAFRLYDFDGVGGGYTCVQVYYDGQWHYFDVTNAGYFLRENTVLSWDQIIKDPETALGEMVIFDQTIDYNLDMYTSALSERERIDNETRMRQIYSLENLSNARSYGFIGDLSNTHRIYPRIDWEKSESEIRVGEIDDSEDDVELAACRRSR